jgi:Sulfotransferase family
MIVPIRVLYVMGHGWSGSTILGNLLGELDGFFHAGELRRLWGEALAANAPCGCGSPVRECRVWSKVLAHPAVAALDPAEVDRWHRRATPVRRTLRLLRMRGEHVYGDLPAYLNAAEKLYRVVAEVTLSRVIVDTSKRSGDAAALLRMPAVDPFFIHLVRDPRAVAHSWSKRSARGHGPVATSRDWVAFNLLDEAIRRNAGPGRSVRLRYEDLIADPEASLRAVAGLVGERPETIPIRRDRVAVLGLNHGIMGNPSRFANGEVPLREDEAWKRDQPPSERLMVTALTLPLLLLYGYPVGTAPRRLP